jgi:hypothetical protein
MDDEAYEEFQRLLRDIRELGLEMALGMSEVEEQLSSDPEYRRAVDGTPRMCEFAFVQASWAMVTASAHSASWASNSAVSCS